MPNEAQAIVDAQLICLPYQEYGISQFLTGFLLITTVISIIAAVYFYKRIS